MAENILITGWGQITQPKDAQPPLLDPVDMMERAARAAGAQSGEGIWPLVDTVLVVRTQSRTLQQPGESLARRLGIRPRTVRVSGIGGEVPQHFVNQAAGMLARGDAEAVLICGAETYYPRAADDVRGESALIQGIPADYAADDAVGSDALEQRHGLTLPIHGFPLFENALWAKSGLSREAWLARVGGLLAGFSAVSAQHPNGWTRAPLTAERIVTPAADNRPICFPYTKRMVSLVMADLGAAIIMTTERHARALRGGAGQPVYFRGGAFAKDRQRFLADKIDFTRSPPLAQIAGMRIAELAGFDLYSCFPCAVNVARSELGLSENDPRPLTQTGGLGYFGGPGSNYALHGIATMAEHIADGKLRSGMTTALGWFMHKYAAGIYADRPGKQDLATHDAEDTASPLAGPAPVARVKTVQGDGTIETYTVVYARDQSPAYGIIYGRTDDGLRFVANSSADPATFTALTTDNQIGRRVHLHVDPSSGTNLAALTGA